MNYGAQIGQAFIARQPDGEVIGAGDYCGFPVVLRLEQVEQDGKRGYRVAIHVAPPKAQTHAD